MRDRSAKRTRLVALLALVPLVPLGGVLPALAQERERPDADAPPPESFVAVPLYRVTGVRDAAGAATLFQCTNTGAANATVSVVIRDFDGVQVCALSFGPLPPNQSVTLATRATALYGEDAVCNPLPLADGGSAILSADSAGSQKLVCTVQVIDPVAATPAFATSLDLFRP